MTLIIDGYNLIFAELHQAEDHRDLERTRQRLIALLTHYNARKRCHIMVVFDSPYRTSNRVKGPQLPPVDPKIEVLFSAPGSDADTLIENIVARSSNPRSLRVVTSDQNLRRGLQKKGVQLIYSGSFFKEIKESLREIKKSLETQEPPEKFSGIPTHEVVGWMKLFGFDKKS